MKRPLTGLRAWSLQRLSAFYLLGFVVYFVARLIAAPPESFQAWRGWILAPGLRTGALLFFVAIGIHAWVGVRDVLIDYVKPFAVRTAALSALALGLAGLVAWSAILLLSR